MGEWAAPHPDVRQRHAGDLFYQCMCQPYDRRQVWRYYVWRGLDVVHHGQTAHGPRDAMRRADRYDGQLVLGGDE